MSAGIALFTQTYISQCQTGVLHLFCMIISAGVEAYGMESEEFE